MADQSTTDILVIGGGLAAISAAIAAAETGAAVIVANKGVTGKSGSSAKAAGILAAAFGHGGLDGTPLMIAQPIMPPTALPLVIILARQNW